MDRCEDELHGAEPAIPSLEPSCSPAQLRLKPLQYAGIPLIALGKR